MLLFLHGCNTDGDSSNPAQTEPPAQTQNPAQPQNSAQPQNNPDDVPFESDFISVKTQGTGPEVILIHGFASSSDVWSGVAKEIGPRFRLHLVSVAGLAGSPAAENVPESYLETIRDEIARYIEVGKLKKPVLIGHSMGGLISLYYTLFFAEKETVKKVITIGSPLKGTIMANIAIGKCGKQMKRGSKLTKKLEKAFNEKKPLNVFHIATEKDTLVIPYQSCFLSEDKKHQYLLKNIGHVEMLYSKKILDKLVYWVKSTESSS